MPAIQEEDVASDIVAPDFSELLDLPDTTFAGTNDIPLGMTVTSDPLQPFSPSLLEPAEYEIRFLTR